MAFRERFWWLVVERAGLVLDTRWVPGARDEARPNVCLYFLLNGTFEVFAPVAGSIHGPVALVMSEEQLEGASKSRSMTYRAFGEPFHAVQVHFPSALIVKELRVDPVTKLRVLDLDDHDWSLVRDIANAARSAPEESVDPILRFVSLLVERGIVRADVTKPILARLSAPLELLWRGVRPMVERLYLTPTVEEVSSATGISVRQVDRNINQFLTRFGHIGGTGWRLATRHMRLKLAIMLLSAEGISIADVAMATSYGSSDAMARAFRDAGLPSPSKIQTELRIPREA